MKDLEFCLFSGVFFKYGDFRPFSLKIWRLLAPKIIGRFAVDFLLLPSYEISPPKINNK
jgi:hypothetical protein